MAVEFGRFRLLPQRRLLQADGRLIELGGRAIDVLLALVSEPGAILSHDELLKRAWPAQVVEENNLQVQISALRKALGPDRGLIRTVVGRGYQFTGLASEAPAQQPAPRPDSNLPAALSDLIGRDEHLAEALGLLADCRLLTLIGSSGVGKSRLGLELARSALDAFPGGVWWVDLGRLALPEQVEACVAAAIGVLDTAARGQAGAREITAAFGCRQVLLVLDNCEHVIGAVTGLAETVLRGCAGARVVVTSREPLHSDGETWYRVAPLAVAAMPAAAVQRDASRERPSAAAELFIARARRADPRFSPDSAGVAAIEEICRRLDGVPLAIEFAAARAPALGLGRLAAGLEDPLQLLAGGNRNALPRHQSMRATLDWSYALLAQRERIVLRRLAVFATSFTLEAAIALVARNGLHAADVVDSVTGMVAKSLVAVDERGPGQEPRYRLLEATRAYGRCKLRERAEFQSQARQHAEYVYAHLREAGGDGQAHARSPACVEFFPPLEDVHAALDWAFSSYGDPALGAAIVTAALPSWLNLPSEDECRRQVERALAIASKGADADTLAELRTALVVSLYCSLVPGAAHPIAASRPAAAMTEAVHGAVFQAAALWGWWMGALQHADLPAALQLAECFLSLIEQMREPLGGGRAASCGAAISRAPVTTTEGGRTTGVLLAEKEMRLSGSRQPILDDTLAVADWAAALLPPTLLQASAQGTQLLAHELEALDRYAQLLLERAGRHGPEKAAIFDSLTEGMRLLRAGNPVAGARVLRRLHGCLGAKAERGAGYPGNGVWLAQP